MSFPLRVLLLAIYVAAIAHARNGVATARSAGSTLAQQRQTSTVAVRTPSSVVQDWSLVCQQLCGAGLGGAPCAAQCEAYEAAIHTRPPYIKSTSSPKTKNMICQDLCALQLGGSTCHCKGKAPVMSENYDLACSTFCDNNNARLRGCSPCGEPPIKSAPQKANKNLDGATALSEVSTTTIATTTPNWNELCASLCKTGDGGSLCNCDLSPFYF